MGGQPNPVKLETDFGRLLLSECNRLAKRKLGGSYIESDHINPPNVHSCPLHLSLYLRSYSQMRNLAL